jgi:hypothetical protein
MTDEYGALEDNWQGKLHCMKNPFASAILLTTNYPVWTTVGFNQGIHIDKLVTKRSSYGTTSILRVCARASEIDNTYIGAWHT